MQPCESYIPWDRPQTSSPEQFWFDRSLTQHCCHSLCYFSVNCCCSFAALRLECAIHVITRGEGCCRFRSRVVPVCKVWNLWSTAGKFCRKHCGSDQAVRELRRLWWFWIMYSATVSPAWTRSAIYLVVVGIALAVSTHGISVHSSYEAVTPFVEDTVSRASHAAGFHSPRLADFLFHRRSARDPQRTVSQEGDPVAKSWPEEFTVNFTTKSGSATGFVAYDWSQKRQVVYHGPNSGFCAGFGTDDACQMLEIPGGTYVYIPSLEQCSLSVPEVGSLPPDWTTNSVYAGVEEVPGVGLCRSFAFPPTAHVWYETVVGSLPCLFVFPDPDMSYYFLPETFEVGTPDEKYFDFPDYCLVKAARWSKSLYKRFSTGVVDHSRSFLSEATGRRVNVDCPRLMITLKLRLASGWPLMTLDLVGLRIL